MEDGIKLLSFEFSGGDADNKYLNLYEAGRFQYAMARFLYITEQFRQKGRVLDRITQKISIDLRVPSAHNDTWVQDVMLFGKMASPALAELFIKVPLDILVAWAMEKINPKKSSTDNANEVIKAVANASEQHAIANQKGTDLASAQLDLIKEMYKDSRKDNDSLRSAMQELSAALNRENILNKYKDSLSKIPQELENKIIDRLQPIFKDIVLPVERSAEELHISGHSAGHKVVYVDRFISNRISGNMTDPLPTTLQGDVIRYDKENGWGKFKNSQFPKSIGFTVPAAARNKSNSEVIDAMKNTLIEASFYYVRTKRKVPKYLILDRVIEFIE